MSDENTKLALLEQEVNRHSQQLEEINDKFKEFMHSFDKKLDNLTSIVEELKPNKNTWEWEQRVISLEQKQQIVDKFKSRGFWALILLAFAIIAPELVPHILDAAIQIKGVP